MKLLFTTFLFLMLTTGWSQPFILDFEDFNLPVDSFLNNSGDEGQFSTMDVIFPNSYTVAPTFSFWSGWAISTTTDTETPGPANESSSISGSGVDNSITYAVSFSPENHIIFPETEGQFISGFYVNNNAYAYLSMLEGDGFAKKFGGETGDDPDFYLLTIKGFRQDEIIGDSVNFYLADYRFTDNSQDYIISDWTFIDLTEISFEADSLSFTLSSSDSGQFGMNTPGYFCLDNFIIDVLSGTNDVELENIKLVNTLVQSELMIENNLDQSIAFQIINTLGQVMKKGWLNNRINQIDGSFLSEGYYWINVQNEGQQWTRVFLKK